MKLVNLNQVTKNYQDAFKTITNSASQESYNELETGYNDLSDRLSAFLETTGGIEPAIENYLVTKSLNSITFSITNQLENDDYTIDWGDGSNTTLSGNGSNLSHNYAETDSYIITLTANNDNSNGMLNGLQNKLSEIYVTTIDCYISDDDTLEKVTVDNLIMTYGSWESKFIYEASALEEVHVKSNCNIQGGRSFIEYCESLTKATIDCSIFNYDNTLFDGCNALTELHLTSTILPTFDNGYLFSWYEVSQIPQNFAIYVPADLVDEYKAAIALSADELDYTNYIVAEPS